MASYDTTETQQLTLGGTDTNATFPGGIQGCFLISTADCYVDFDQPAVTSRSFLLKANTMTNLIDFSKGSIQKVHGITTGGAATLHILGLRR